MIPAASALPTRADPTAGPVVVTVTALALACALIAFVAHAVPEAWTGRLGLNHFQDDAFYYLVPARHFLVEGRFTFDGIAATNGFHPLWMALVVAVLAIIGPAAPPEQQVLAVELLERAALASACAICALRVIRGVRDGDPVAAGFLAALVVLLCPWYVVFEQGMETTLAAALLLGVAAAFLDGRERMLAALLVLLFLCRLDTGPFVGLPLALAFFATAHGRRMRRLMPLVTLLAAIALVSAINLLATGHAVPISGAIKSSFPRLTPHWGYLVEPFNVARLAGAGAWLVYLNIVLCIAVLAAGTLLVLLVPARVARLRVLALAGAGALLVANLLLFQRWEKSVDPRYFALPLVLGALALGTGLATAVRRAATGLRFGGAQARSGASAAWIALLAVPLAAEAVAQLHRLPAAMAARDDPQRALFRDLAATLPADAVLAGTDVGALAFWTGRPVVNLDGVMNDWRYQEVLRDQQLAQYLRQRKVTHLATALWDRAQAYTARPVEPMYRHQVDPDAQRGRDYACHRFYVYSYVHARYSDALCLAPSQEVFRRDVGRDGIANAAYVVYRIGP